MNKILKKYILAIISILGLIFVITAFIYSDEIIQFLYNKDYDYIEIIKAILFKEIDTVLYVKSGADIKKITENNKQ
jgi:hypothetical protein